MINVRNFGGGYSVPTPSSYEKGGKALTALVSFHARPTLTRGGLRWTKEVTPYG